MPPKNIDPTESELFREFHIRRTLDVVPVSMPRFYEIAKALIMAQEQYGQEVETIAQEALKLVGEFRSRRRPPARVHR